MEKPRIIIAIDGCSSSGKSTMARTLARAIGYTYIDSGAMYRAVTLYALDNDFIHDGKPDAGALVKALPDIHISFGKTADGTAHTFLNGRDVEKEIRTMRVAEAVSPVSAIPEVRHRLVAMQQEMGADKGIVMDGRDIGTTVFPDAELKIFVDASSEVRATRRLKELIAKGVHTSYEEVRSNIMERDHIDRTRKESPLRKADDAIVFDNDTLTLEQQDEWLLNVFNKKIAEIEQAGN